MDEKELRSMVERMVLELAGQTPSAPAARTAAVRREEVTDGCLEDITQTDLRRQYLVQNPRNGEAFQDLKLKTPARLGLGRAGARYRTLSMLRMRADHAAAQDSVFSHVPDEFATTNGFVPVQTLCQTKDEYMRNLSASFASKDFINIRFANTDVVKMGKGEDIYAIQIRQDYVSSNYGDVYSEVVLNDFVYNHEAPVDLRYNSYYLGTMYANITYFDRGNGFVNERFSAPQELWLSAAMGM